MCSLGTSFNRAASVSPVACEQLTGPIPQGCREDDTEELCQQRAQCPVHMGSTQDVDYCKDDGDCPLKKPGSAPFSQNFLFPQQPCGPAFMYSLHSSFLFKGFSVHLKVPGPTDPSGYAGA